MDAGAFLAIVFWAAIIVGGTTWFLRRYARTKAEDHARREAAREAYDRREDEKERAAALTELDRYFPAFREPFQEAVNGGAKPEAAFWEAVNAVETVELGTTFYGLPALLPLAERRKHLYVVGKPGQGKTTLLLHLINADLEAGRGVAVIAPEAELFRDWLLSMVPDERTEDVVYFAPGNPKNTITFNPLAVDEGDDRARAAGDLFAIFKRAMGEDEFGARMSPILSNAFSALVGRPSATLWDVKRLLEDADFRAAVARSVDDPYVAEFWSKTYPSYPKGSHLPVVNRLDQFLGSPPVRRALCHPTSTLSIGQILATNQILFVDLSGLADDSKLLLGQMILAKFQLELHRRETVNQALRESFYLYADEFQTFAGVAEGTWRELLSRGRRYGLAMTLAHQHPAQLPSGLRDEISGTASSMVAFNLGAKDAETMRREFIEESMDSHDARPIPMERLVTLRPGRAVARLGTGAFAIPLQTTAPLEEPPAWRGEKVQALSWERFGAPYGEILKPIEGGEQRTRDTIKDFLEWPERRPVSEPPTSDLYDRNYRGCLRY